MPCVFISDVNSLLDEKASSQIKPVCSLCALDSDGGQGSPCGTEPGGGLCMTLCTCCPVDRWAPREGWWWGMVWPSLTLKGRGWGVRVADLWAGHGCSRWSRGADQQNEESSPHPGPSSACPGRRCGCGRGRQNAFSILISPEVSSGGRGRRWSGEGGTGAGLVCLQSGTELSLSLSLPTSLGGQGWHPHVTNRETEVPGLGSQFLLTHSWVSVLSPESAGRGGRWPDRLITLTVWHPLRPEAAGGKY